MASQYQPQANACLVFDAVSLVIGLNDLHKGTEILEITVRTLNANLQSNQNLAFVLIDW